MGWMPAEGAWCLLTDPGVWHRRVGWGGVPYQRRAPAGPALASGLHASCCLSDAMSSAMVQWDARLRGALSDPGHTPTPGAALMLLSRSSSSNTFVLIIANSDGCGAVNARTTPPRHQGDQSCKGTPLLPINALRLDMQLRMM